MSPGASKASPAPGITQHVDLSTTGVKIVYSAGAQPLESPLVPVEKLRQRLIEAYHRNTKLPTLFSNVEVNVGELYIPLAMLDDEALSKQQAQTERSTQSYLSKENQHLKWSELFYDKQKKQTFQRVIVRGLAGSGKTTLNRRIAWEWCQHQARGPALLGRFDWVFWLPLRNVQLLLSEKDQGRNLGEFVYDLYFSSDILDESGQAYERNNIIASLNKLICQNGPNTLWLLDGYDEINRNHLKAFENRLLERLKECGATFLLTSRPSAKISAQVKSDRQVTTRGFTWKELQQYVKVFYQRQAATQVNWQELAQGLVSFLKQQPRLQQLGFTPINAELICCLWQQRQAQVSDLENVQLKHATLTSLYTAVMEYLLRRHLTYCHESGKTWEIEGQPQPYDEENRRLWTSSVVFRVNKSLLQVSELLAFLSFTKHGHKEKDIVILPTVLRQTMDLMKINDMSMGKHIINLCRIGLLHPTSDVVEQDLKRHYDKISDSSINYLEQNYEFMHLSFQEMLVGRFIARKYRKKNTLPVAGQEQTVQQWFTNNKWEPSYQLVWEFTLGHLAQDSQSGLSNTQLVTRFVNLLLLEPRDLTRRQEALMLMRWFEEGFLALAESQRVCMATYLGELYSVVMVQEEFESYLEVFSQNLNQCYLLKQQNEFFQPAKAMLNSKNSRVRNHAAQALGQQSFLPESIIEKFSNLLDGWNKDVQYCVTSALSTQLSLPEAILEKFVKFLADDENTGSQFSLDAGVEKHPDDDLKNDAANALSNQSSLPEAILEKLVKLLVHYDGDIRFHAKGALRNHSLPKALLAKLSEQLTDKNAWVRSEAVKILGNWISLPEAILEKFVELLADESEYASRDAAEVLEIQSSLSKGIVVHIDRGSKYVCRNVAEALGNQSSLPESILEKLIELLADENEGTCGYAVEVLRQQSSLPENTLALLGERLDDENYRVRSSAAEVLGRQSSLPKKILALLTERLTDGEGDVRVSAMDALGCQQSPLPERVLALLVKRLADKNYNVQISAASALGKQSFLPEAILGKLGELLTVMDFRGFEHASNILRNQSPLPEVILEKLSKLLMEKNEYIRSLAADTFCNQSSLPESISALLVKRLTDKSSWVRNASAKALCNQSFLSEVLLVKLSELLAIDNFWVRDNASKILSSQSSLSEVLLAKLGKLLMDENSLARSHAIDILGSQSSLPDVILTKLSELLVDENSGIRFRVVKALGNQSILSEALLAKFCELIANKDYMVRDTATVILRNQSPLPEALLTKLGKHLLAKNRLVRTRAIDILSGQSSLPSNILALLVERLADEDKWARSRARRLIGQQSSVPQSLHRLIKQFPLMSNNLNLLASIVFYAKVVVYTAAEQNVNQKLLDALNAKFSEAEWPPRIKEIDTTEADAEEESEHEKKPGCFIL